MAHIYWGSAKCSDSELRVALWLMQLATVQQVINEPSPAAITLTPHLARALVHKVEDGLLLGVPVDALAQSPPSQLACDYFEQVHLDRLLNEHHVVLRHAWSHETDVSGDLHCSLMALKKKRRAKAKLTKAVVVGGVGFVFRHNGTEHFGPLQGV